MMEEGKDEFYYITAMNENYDQPSMPEKAEAGIIKGLYLFKSHGSKKGVGFVRLLGSGAILPEVDEAAKMLEAEWDVSSEVWSATSYSELARDAREAERRNRLNPLDEPVVSHLAACLPSTAPIIAASDYVRTYPQMIAAYVGAQFIALGTDGFGRSDTRQALRAFFEVDRRSIVIAALSSLASERLVAPEVVADAIERYGVNPSAPPPWTI
jgi:pyruvate dehydrogenase E1 component